MTDASDLNGWLAKGEKVLARAVAPDAQRHAALVVCDRADSIDDAAELLRAIGLADPEHARVWRKQDSTLGHKPEPPFASATRKDCGTVPGAQAHHRAGEPLCPLCQAWSDERHRRTRVIPGARCGSKAGAQHHRDLGEQVCDRCRAGEAGDSRARYKPTGNATGRPRKHPEVA